MRYQGYKHISRAIAPAVDRLFRAGLATLVAVTIATPQVLAEDDVSGKYPDLRQRAAEATQTYQKKLKSALISAIRDGGPQKAIAVCHDKAPRIADSVGTEYGLEIGRTARKTRNKSNAPNKWERAVIQSFEHANSSKKDTEKLEASKLEGENYRYMKAIKMKGVCATCHGKQVNPGLKDRIEQYYPHDSATGFEIGDIRGAFTVTVPLDDQSQNKEETQK